MSYTYRGRRVIGSPSEVVRVEQIGDTPLPLRLDLRRHSPDGFEWGYQGSGPSQLSLALLCDFTNSDPVAMRLYQKFKSEVISQMAGDTWELVPAVFEKFLQRNGCKYADNAKRWIFKREGTVSRVCSRREHAGTDQGVLR